MILSKKNLLVILIFSIAAIGFYQYIAFLSGNQVLKQSDLQEYITTYLDTYKSIIEPPSNLTGKEIESFKFYSGYPYSAFGIISESHGAVIQFIPKSKEPYQINETNDRIEDIGYPRISNNRIFPAANVIIRGSNEVYADNARSNTVVKFVDSPNVHSTNFTGDIIIENSTLYYANLTKTIPNLYVEDDATLVLNGVSRISETRIFRKGNIILNGILIDDEYNIIAQGVI